MIAGPDRWSACRWPGSRQCHLVVVPGQLTLASDRVRAPYRIHHRGAMHRNACGARRALPGAHLNSGDGGDGSSITASSIGHPCPGILALKILSMPSGGPYLSHRNLKSHIAWSRRLACQRSRSAQGSEYRHRWKAGENVHFHGHSLVLNMTIANAVPITGKHIQKQ